MITKAGESNNVRDIGYALKVIDDSITQFGENNTYNPAFNEFMDIKKSFSYTIKKPLFKHTIKKGLIEPFQSHLGKNPNVNVIVSPRAYKWP
ncbi:MAG: hypothetical protein O2951_16625 [Bacteroidetes bacterium]|nr:hypothetical protein [Bacteroidota bacterium]